MRAYCSYCHETKPNCKDSPRGLVHLHYEPTLFFGRLEKPMRAFKNEQTYRLELNLAYYDMITLPTGGHIPVPIAVHLIGKEAVEGIPMDRQHWRDERFYHCDKCLGEGLSFFYCREHQTIDLTEYHHAKEVYLVSLAELKQLKKCRYVRAKDRVGFSREDRY